MAQSAEQYWWNTYMYIDIMNVVKKKEEKEEEEEEKMDLSTQLDDVVRA